MLPATPRLTEKHQARRWHTFARLTGHRFMLMPGAADTRCMMHKISPKASLSISSPISCINAPIGIKGSFAVSCSPHSRISFPMQATVSKRSSAGVDATSFLSMKLERVPRNLCFKVSMAWTLLPRLETTSSNEVGRKRW